MSEPFLPASVDLSTCGCCEGTSPETPRDVTNPPAQSAVQRRVGRYPEFVESLDAALGRQLDTNLAPLRGLTTRDTDDFTVALLDAWAVASDVLTFYQERISNETYRRTATERTSLYDLARLIGYRPTPGVAASVDLAFSLDDFANVPPIHAELTSGLKVQSVPAGKETPQLYETTETIQARSEWNALKPRSHRPQAIVTTSERAVFAGEALNVLPGDTVLIRQTASALAVKKVAAVHVDKNTQQTTLDFVSTPATPPAYVRPTLPDGIVEAVTETELDSGTIAFVAGRSWHSEDLAALCQLKGWSEQALEDALNDSINAENSTSAASVFVFRQHAAIFGHNAPKWNSLPASMRYTTRVEIQQSDNTFALTPIPPPYPTDWDARTLEADASPTTTDRFVYLDNAYPGIAAGSWIVLTSPTTTGASVTELPLSVVSNLETTRTDFSISGKSSRLTVAHPTAIPAEFRMRTTTVLGQSESLPIAPVPITDDVAGFEVVLNGAFMGLRPGQLVVVSGERVDLPGVIEHEIRLLDTVLISSGVTVLQFDTALDNAYPRETVAINANVAPATHGETRHEILGSGDGSQSFQRFALRQPPLTSISSSSATGVESTLRVYVNDVLWTEVPFLYGHGPTERIYSTWTDDTGVTIVQCGDGQTGSRLPRGQDNVRAIYRRGIGIQGLVTAGQLTAPMTRPLGLRGVTNPLPSAGAADPEGLDEARDNLPLQVMTLERVVSRRDYEDFARAFAGVRKALAVQTWDGERGGVFITVAGPDGAAINPGGDVYDNLFVALHQFGDPHTPIELKTYRPALFRIDATITYDPTYLPENVKPEIETALRQAFRFDARTFGQPVVVSEVIGAIHEVKGVVAIDINELFRTDKTPANHPEPRLGADLPSGGQAAELLTLDPAPITLG